MKKSYYVLITVLLLFIITNPSVKAFKEYLGRTNYSQLRRDYNFFLCGLYNYHGDRYFAIAGNFFKIDKPIVHKPPTDPFAEFGGHLISSGKSLQDSTVKDTSLIDNLLPPPPPKGLTKIASLPYSNRVYLALSENAKGFHLTKNEFSSRIQKKEYALKIYEILKENFEDFKRTRKEFLDSLKTK